MAQAPQLGKCTIKRIKTGLPAFIRLNKRFAGERTFDFDITVNVGGQDETLTVHAERVRCFGNGSAEFRLRAVPQMAEAH